MNYPHLQNGIKMGEKMKDYLNEINDLFPVRKKFNDKTKFIEYVKQEVTEYDIEIQQQKKTRNVVIGDIEKAKVVFTAHYDTPARSVIPNIMMPVNKVIYFGYTIVFAMIIVTVSLTLARHISAMLEIDNRQITISIYLVIYFASFYFMMLAFENKHNKNDNTSGVATVMSLIKSIDKNSNVAFILFDDEEKGLVGSKKFYNKHKKIMEDKPLINLDCVGNGNEIVVILNNEEMTYANLLKETVVSSVRYNVRFYNKKQAMGNSDQKHFKNGVGVFACHKGKFIKLYTPYIHTSKDTVADVENIDFLIKRLTNFVNKINEER